MTSTGDSLSQICSYKASHRGSLRYNTQSIKFAKDWTVLISGVEYWVLMCVAYPATSAEDWVLAQIILVGIIYLSSIPKTNSYLKTLKMGEPEEDLSKSLITAPPDSSLLLLTNLVFVIDLIRRYAPLTSENEILKCPEVFLYLRTESAISFRKSDIPLSRVT
ncbi:unnamed protein product [Hermetia illucens]|uniref:Uncharacterized protein n=1 Tax=Hermetia illucens TaxID=343691 RepID=A0A7R8UAL8_HERIL|nr:unnamed protein product [Hermetia illucens]